MKKKIMLFLGLFFMPFMVSADSVSIICDNDVVKNTTLTCTLRGESSKLVTAVSAKVRSGANISFSSFERNNVWQGDGNEGKIDLYTAEDISGNFVIGNINFNVASVADGNNTSITIDSVYFYDENGKETTIKTINKNIRIAATENRLESLSLSNGSLKPSFNSNTTTYSATINTSSVVVNAKAKSDYSVISGNIGKVNLKPGSNTIKISVTSESGSTKTYTININTPQSNTGNDAENNNKSNNTNLKSITLSKGSISFNKDRTNYDISVNSDINNIEVNAITEDSKAKVTVSGNKNLKVGNNKIEIKVIAEDGSSKLYIINVLKKDKDYVLSSNNYISNITIKNYDIKFNKDTSDYVLKIKDEKELDITVELEDSKSSYVIDGNKDLDDGSIIKIKVNAEDNSERVYNINIEKKDINITIIFIVIIIILVLVNVVRIIFKYKRGKANEGNN